MNADEPSPKAYRRFFARIGIATLCSIWSLWAFQAASGVSMPPTVEVVDQAKPNSVALQITPKVTSKVSIEYGSSKFKLTNRTPIIELQAKASHTFVLSSARANSTIFYRVWYQERGASQFATTAVKSLSLASSNMNQVFAIEADPHMDENSDAATFSATLSQIKAASPAFLMDLGDIFMVDKLQTKTDANIRSRYQLMKSFYDQLGSTFPLYLTMGNHDGETGYESLNTRSYRKEYFPAQTGALNYYSFTSPNALYVVLDPFTYTTKKPNTDGWGWTLGKTQYDWLKTTLESSAAQHKFIFIHHLVGGSDQARGGIEFAKFFEWGGLNKDGSFGFSQQRLGWAKPIHQLLVDNGVDAVFKGHDHFYAKQELDGIVYQTLPQPSHPGDKLTSPAEYGYFSGDILGGSGYLKVTLSGATAKVEFVKSTGEIAASYVMNDA